MASYVDVSYSDTTNTNRTKEEKILPLKLWLECWIENGSYPHGSIILGENNNGVVNEIACYSYGHMNHKEQIECKRDTIYRIFSMTKPITTIAAMILMDRGLLDINHEVSKYIPSFVNLRVVKKGVSTVNIDVNDTDALNECLEPLERPITIHHLLTQTSGISYGLFGNSISDQLLKKHSHNDSSVYYVHTPLATLCNDVIAKSPLAFQPGTSFLYGLSTDVLGYIIEIISGKSLDIFLQDEIFTPLDMIDTSFTVPETKLERLAECYKYYPNNKESCLAFNECLGGEYKRDKAHALLSGGGGLVSTIDDYSKFCTFLLNNGNTPSGISLLDRKWIDEMTRNQFPNNQSIMSFAHDDSFKESLGNGFSFGYGVSVLDEPMIAKGGRLSRPGEYGWGGVASTFFFIDPELNIFGIFMTQLVPSSIYPIRAQMRYNFHKTYLSIKHENIT